jgi:hypothetical protein
MAVTNCGSSLMLSTWPRGRLQAAHATGERHGTTRPTDFSPHTCARQALHARPARASVATSTSRRMRERTSSENVAKDILRKRCRRLSFTVNCLWGFYHSTDSGFRRPFRPFETRDLDDIGGGNINLGKRTNIVFVSFARVYTFS